MRYKFFIFLFALFGLSNAEYSGGTMRWKQIDSSTVRIEARIFNTRSDCTSIYGFPQEISFGYTPMLHTTETVGSAQTATISNTTAYKCFDVFEFKGEYAEARFFVFHVDVSSESSSTIYVWLDSSIKMFTKITLGYRKFFNGRSTYKYNESPFAGFFPYLKVLENEQNSYTLSVLDPNLDKVKCRLATTAEHGENFAGSEINGITMTYYRDSNLTVNENCSMTFNSETGGDIFGIGLMLEDYQYADEGTSEPLSLVPVQFILSVAPSSPDRSPFSQQTDACRENQFVSDNKYETQYGISKYTEIPISPNDPVLAHVEMFSTLHTVLNGSLRTDENNVIHFDGSLVWLIDSNFTYSDLEIICYAGTTLFEVHESMECFFLTDTSSNFIDVIIGSPSPNSIQRTNLNKFEVYFSAAVSEFADDGAGHFRLYQGSNLLTDLTLNQSCTTDCQFVPAKNGLTLTVSNSYVNGQSYNVQYKIPVEKYCLSPKAISDETTWPFTTKIYKQSDVTYYTQNMKLYTDRNFNTEVTYPFIANLGDYINVGITIAGQTGMNALIYRCYATQTSDFNDADYYEIISNGCKKDNLVYITSSSYPNLQFYFAAFRFSNSDSSEVYLHCQTKLCMPNTDASLCTPDCSARKRRHVDDSELTYLKVGPIIINHDGRRNSPINRMEDEQHITTDGNKNKSIPFMTKATQKLILIVYGTILGTIAFGYFLYRWYWHHYCLE